MRRGLAFVAVLGAAVSACGTSAEEAPQTALSIAFFAGSEVAPIHQVTLVVETSTRTLIDAAVPEVKSERVITDGSTLEFVLPDDFAEPSVRIRAHAETDGFVYAFVELDQPIVVGRATTVIVKLERAFCGDGRVLGLEACEPTSSPMCNAFCEFEQTTPLAFVPPSNNVFVKSVCGNGEIEAGEVCEPGRIRPNATCLSSGFLPPSLSTAGQPRCESCLGFVGCGARIDTPQKIAQAVRMVNTSTAIRETPGRTRIAIPAGTYDGGNGVFRLQCNQASITPLGDVDPQPIPCEDNPPPLLLGPLGGTVHLRNVQILVETSGHRFVDLEVSAPSSLATATAFHIRGERNELVGNLIQISSNQHGVVLQGPNNVVLGNMIEANANNVANVRNDGIRVAAAPNTIAMNMIRGAVSRGISIEVPLGPTDPLDVVRVEHNTIANDLGAGLILRSGDTCVRNNLIATPTMSPSTYVAFADEEGVLGRCPTEATARLQNVVAAQAGTTPNCSSAAGMAQPCNLVCNGANACTFVNSIPIDTRTGCPTGRIIIDASPHIGYDKQSRLPSRNCMGQCFSGMGPDVGARELGAQGTFARRRDYLCSQ